MYHKDVFFSSSEFEVAVEKKRVGGGRRETGESAGCHDSLLGGTLQEHVNVWQDCNVCLRIMIAEALHYSEYEYCT